MLISSTIIWARLSPGASTKRFCNICFIQCVRRQVTVVARQLMAAHNGLSILQFLAEKNVYAQKMTHDDGNLEDFRRILSDKNPCVKAPRRLGKCVRLQGDYF